MADLATLVNGNAFDYSSIKITMADPVPIEFERVVAINYEHSLDPDELRGQGPKPLADTTGTYTTRASMSMYLGDWYIFRKLLTAMVTQSGGFMQKRFQVIVSYAEAGEQAVTDTLRGCRVIKTSKAYRRSNDALMVDIDLYVAEILEDGDEAVSQGFDNLIANLATGA